MVFKIAQKILKNIISYFKSSWCNYYIIDCVQAEKGKKNLFFKIESIHLNVGCDTYSQIPKTCGSISSFFSEKVSRVFKDAFILKLNYGQVMGRNGYVLNCHNALFSEFPLFHGEKPDFDNHPVKKHLKKPKVKKINATGIVLANFSTNNYYHWMIESVPRIGIIEESSSLKEKDVLWVTNSLKCTYIVESLAYFSISPNSLIECNDHRILKFKKLIVPSMPLTRTPAPIWVLKYLRKKFISSQKHNLASKNKLFVNRSNNSRRRILNIEAARKALEEYGYEEVILDNINLSKQIDLFKSAKSVVGIHGAALTNLIFCDPGTNVLELFPTSYIKDHYWSISDSLKFEYRYLLCKDVESGNELSNQGVNLNIEVDIDLLKRELNIQCYRENENNPN